MSDQDIRIRIGVVTDASASSVMQPIEQSVRRTRRAIDAEMRAASKAIASEMQKGTTSGERAWQKLEREVEREAEQILKAQERAEKLAAREFERGEKAKTQSAKKEAQERERIAARAAREQARTEKAAAREVENLRKAREKAAPFYQQDMFGSGGAIGVGRRAGIRVSRGTAMAWGLTGRAASAAMGIGRDILGGIGVDTDLSSLVAKSQEQQSLATKISNSGYVPGTDLVAPGTILSEARAAGNATGTDTTEVLKAIQDFVGKTGDLRTARDTIGDMAKLSRATGTDLSDMANAAAEVANNLQGVPDKAAATKQIMQQIAGQGKLGAVEIKDLASQMAKLASTSAQFKGGAAKNLATFGVIAQEAKLHGGAASATQAATSTMALANTLTTKSTIRHWKEMGLTPFSDAKQTTLADPKELIIAALKRTGGNLEALKTLFPSSQGMRAVRGFANVFNAAGGGKKGEQAVRDEFDTLSKAQLDNAEVSRAFAASMQNSDAQVTVFNNKMAEVAEQLAGAVLPAFKDLAPAVVNTTTAFVNAVDEFMGTKAPREQQEAISTEITAIQDRGKVQRSVQRDPATGQLTMPAESQQLLQSDASKLAERLLRQKKIVAEDHEVAAGLGERLSNAHGFMETIEAPSKWLGDLVTGKQSAAKDKERIDRQEQSSLESQQSITNDLLRDIRDKLANGELRVIPRTGPTVSGTGRDPGGADVDQDGGH